jgi:hypothetical protein
MGKMGKSRPNVADWLVKTDEDTGETTKSSRIDVKR